MGRDKAKTKTESASFLDESNQQHLVFVAEGGFFGEDFHVELMGFFSFGGCGL